MLWHAPLTCGMVCCFIGWWYVDTGQSSFLNHHCLGYYFCVNSNSVRTVCVVLESLRPLVRFETKIRPMTWKLKVRVKTNRAVTSFLENAGYAVNCFHGNCNTARAGIVKMKGSWGWEGIWTRNHVTYLVVWQLCEVWSPLFPLHVKQASCTCQNGFWGRPVCCEVVKTFIPIKLLVT